jgi:hypothetical protein
MIVNLIADQSTLTVGVIVGIAMGVTVGILIVTVVGAVVITFVVIKLRQP